MRISLNYLDFFSSVMDERYIFCQGGRRSGKTINTILWLQMLGKVRGQEITIMVVNDSFPALQKTFQDFTLATGLSVRGSLMDGYSCKDENISWHFAHFDDYTKAQGTMADYLFINEAVNLKNDIIEVLVQGIREQVYFNYNPTKHPKFERWYNDNNLMVTTWKDNPYLTPAQVEEFEQLKVRAQRAGATQRDIYLYEVYYCGNFSEMTGAVFSHLGKMTLQDYKEVPAQEIVGIDFGFATSGDPTVVVGVKLYDGKLYCHQYIYEVGLTSDYDLAHKLHDCGFNAYTLMLADHGGMGKGRISTLVTADNGRWIDEEIRQGFNIQNAYKTKILDGLSQLLSLDGIFITETSHKMREEFEGYEIDDKGKPKGSDHTIDAVRYAGTYAKNFLQ